MRKTAKQKVVEHLNNAGFSANEEDIKIVRGPKRKSDILQCWWCFCPTSKHRSAEVSSIYTLTELANGLRVRKATDQDPIHGEWLCEPLLVVKG